MEGTRRTIGHMLKSGISIGGSNLTEDIISRFFDVKNGVRIASENRCRRE
jgi:hypothetical protein